MDIPTFLISVASSVGLGGLVSHFLDERAYRTRAHFDRHQAQRETVDAIHGHVMNMMDALSTRQLNDADRSGCALSPDEASSNRLGALAETAEGRVIVDRYGHCKLCMRRGALALLDEAERQLAADIAQWRKAHP